MYVILLFSLMLDIPNIVYIGISIVSHVFTWKNEHIFELMMIRNWMMRYSIKVFEYELWVLRYELGMTYMNCEHKYVFLMSVFKCEWWSSSLDAKKEETVWVSFLIHAQENEYKTMYKFELWPNFYTLTHSTAPKVYEYQI